MGGSVLRPGPFLSLVFLSFEFVWDLLLRISDFKHARTVRASYTRKLKSHSPLIRRRAEWSGVASESDAGGEDRDGDLAEELRVGRSHWVWML